MKLVFILSFLLAFLTSANAADVKLTAQNQGYYVVSVDGKDISNHTAEREAIEKAVNVKTANPKSVVKYRHEYVVTVELTGTVATTPPPAPPPPAPTLSSVMLYWDPVSVADGYNVHYGTTSKKYTTKKDAGKVVQYKLDGLTIGTTYFFAVTAYKSGAPESVFSNEVAKKIQ